MSPKEYILLLELNEVLYEEVYALNRCEAIEKDEDLRKDINAKKRLLFLAAKIMQDLTYHEGEHFAALIRQGVKEGLTLFHCDLGANLDKIMPPP